MSTVKDLKDILRQHKRNTPACAPYSKLNKKELEERVKRLGKVPVVQKQTVPIPVSEKKGVVKKPSKQQTGMTADIEGIIKKIKSKNSLSQYDYTKIREFRESYKQKKMFDLYNKLKEALEEL
jgi:hypothetical protein